MKWRTRSKGRFYEAGESTVIYFDSYSGDTHLLTDLAADIMRQLGDDPLTTDDLMQQLSASFESPDDTALTQAVSGVLDELVSLDLLTRG